MHVPTPV